MEKYYILYLWGGFDPQPLIGPYKTYKNMLRRVKKFLSEESEDYILWVHINNKGIPSVHSFSNKEIEELTI